MRICLPLLALLSLSGGSPLAAEPVPESPPEQRSEEQRSEEQRSEEQPPEELPPEELPPEETLPPEEPAPEELAPPRPEEPERPGPFAQGKFRFGFGGGLQSSREVTNFGLGLSLGYYLFDNLELGVDGAFQLGDAPFASYLGPTARVMFPINEAVAPYVGVFYRHWFVSEGFLDLDTLGFRGGLLVRTGGAYFGIGIVYESIVSTCSDKCSDIYPELGVSVVF